MSAPILWDPTVPLAPSGTWLLEASAGTGKTWQLSSLVARMVVELGVPIDQQLVITFTRAATAELRDRIRRRLVEVRQALLDPSGLGADPVLVHLAGPSVDDTERQARLERVELSLTRFDLAPISTIHGFCQRTLDTLAFESGQDADLTLVEDVSVLVDTWVADTLAQIQAQASPLEMALWKAVGFSAKDLKPTAALASGAVKATLEPQPGASRPHPRVRALAEDIRVLGTWWQQHGPGLGAALQADMTARKADYHGTKVKTLAKATPRLDDWLTSPGSPAGLVAALANLAPETMPTYMKKGRAPFDHPLLHALAQEAQPVVEHWKALNASAPLAWFAQASKQHIDAELRRRRELSFDAILTRLADAVREQGADGSLARAIRGQLQVAFVDEFQDTDSAQWDVLRLAFHGQPGRRLFLIGDPKQAIYAFRGADVFVYLAAKGSVRAASQGGLATMRTNHRSDDALVQAMNDLWQEKTGIFGQLDMDYLRVDTPHHHAGSALGGAGRAALEVRWLTPELVGEQELPLPMARMAPARWLAARSCAAEVRHLLDGACTLAGSDGSPRPVRPGDVAVLVHSHLQASLVRAALAETGIMAVASGKRSVLESQAADWLLTWLDALAAPGRESQARALAVCPLFGFTLAQLEDALQEAEDDHPPEAHGGALHWETWRQSLHDQASAWPKQRFAGVFQRVLADYGVIERLLGLDQGERHATDLRHLLELCHAAEQRDLLGPDALARWLRQERTRSQDADVHSLRLESDAEAVQIVTIHKSKGLQYPIVLLPYAWNPPAIKVRDKALVVHPHRDHADPALRAQAVLDLHPKSSEVRAPREAQYKLEQGEEAMRKHYVALTRAQHHCVVWLGVAGSDSVHAAAHRLALRELVDGTWEDRTSLLDSARAYGAARSAKSRDKALARWTGDWPQVRGLLDARFPGAWRLARSPQLRERWRPPHSPEDPLRAAVLPELHLPGPWRRASFSSMVAGRTVHEDEPVLAEALATTPLPADPGLTPVQDQEPQVSSAPAPALPLAEMWGGPVVGTWAHAVLENLDFATQRERADRATEPRDLPDLVRDLGQRHGHRRKADHELLAAALPGILTTPLHSAPGLQGVRPTSLPEGSTLEQLALADRMDELAFDLSVAGGAHWTPARAPLQARAVHQALARNAACATWDGQAWIDALLARSQAKGWSVLPPMAGILTGFIDIVFRVDGRYYLADWKSNKIRSQARPESTAAHYTRPWLAWAMAHSGYHLQSLLYTVALHRFLGLRVADYDYDQHMGGHLYLFLRGMTGAAALQADGHTLGVYADRWPRQVVTALDLALQGGES